MRQTPKENVLENVISKLKENASYSEDFFNDKVQNPVSKNIGQVVTRIKSVITADAKDQQTKAALSFAANALESVKDNYVHHMDAATRALKDYNTYVYALETLYNEYGNGNGNGQGHGNGNSNGNGNGHSTYEPVKGKEVVSEVKSSVRARPAQPRSEAKIPDQARPAQPKQKAVSPYVLPVEPAQPIDLETSVIQEEEKPKEKSRFKFSFP